LADRPSRPRRSRTRLALPSGPGEGEPDGVPLQARDDGWRAGRAADADYQTLPIVDPAFWNDLERWILDSEAQPNDYLHCKHKVRPNRYRNGEQFVQEFRDQPMGVNGLHLSWYGCLQRAGVTAKGQTSDERIHKARHTAGPRVPDATHGIVKAVQKLSATRASRRPVTSTRSGTSTN